MEYVIPTITLASALARWLTAVPNNNNELFTIDVTGTTVRAVLDSFFKQYPQMRGYICDERGTLRHHVVAFVNNEPVTDKQTLSEPVPPMGEVYIAQALSGG